MIRNKGRFQKVFVLAAIYWTESKLDPIAERYGYKNYKLVSRERIYTRRVYVTTKVEG